MRKEDDVAVENSVMETCQMKGVGRDTSGPGERNDVILENNIRFFKENPNRASSHSRPKSLPPNRVVGPAACVGLGQGETEIEKTTISGSSKFFATCRSGEGRWRWETKKKEEGSRSCEGREGEMGFAMFKYRWGWQFRSAKFDGRADFGGGFACY
jgi:hypothetical protein